MNADAGPIPVPAVLRRARGLPLLVTVGLGMACGIVFLKSWILGLTVLASMLVAAVAIQSPRACWRALLLLTLVLASYIPPSMSTPLFWAALILFLAGAWMEHAEGRHPPELPSASFWAAVAAWGAWGALCAWHALDRIASVKELGRYLLSFATLLTYVNWLRAREQVQDLFRWTEVLLVTAGSLRLMDAILKASFGGIPVPLVGPYPPENSELGLGYAAMLPVMASVLAVSPRWRLWPRRMSFALLCAALVASGSRAACLAGFVGVCTALWMRWPFRGRRWLTAGVLAAAALGCAWVWSRYQSHPEGIQRLLSGRDLVWRAALQAIGEHPWLGIGPGNWSVWFQRRFVAADFLLWDAGGNTFVLPPDRLGGEAHQLFLTKGAEMGLVSVILLVALLAAWFRSACRSMQRLPEGWERAVALGCIASMGGLLIFGFFENGPIIGKARGAEVVIVWLLAAFPFAAHRMVRSSRRTASPLTPASR